MPKDNEVDEKATKGVVATVCTVPDLSDNFAGVELQLFGSYEPRIGDEFYSAATVAELRAEVSALSHELDCVNANWQASMAHAKTLRTKADAAERRAGELEAALKPLADACYAEFCSAATELKEPNISKVSYPEETCNITFGMIRNARKALTGADPT